MNIGWIIVAVLIGMAFFAYIIKLWLEYKKVAVKTKGYPTTTGITFLFLAFLALTGILSLSDKLLNSLLLNIGIKYLDPNQSSDYKWMLFAAFIILSISVILILKNRTKSVNKNTVKQGVGSLATDNGDISLTQHFHASNENSEHQKVTSHLVDENKRKNAEIDELKEKLKKSLSEEEKIHLSNKINQLEEEVKKSEKEKQELEERLEEYSQDVEIVSKANELYKHNGIDEALNYLEGINFDNVLKNSIEHAKALLIKADIYTIKNEHQKADDAYVKSIKFNRNFDNVITYSNYLRPQHK